jgi:hypothetical protein
MENVVRNLSVVLLSSVKIFDKVVLATVLVNTVPLLVFVLKRYLLFCVEMPNLSTVVGLPLEMSIFSVGNGIPEEDVMSYVVSVVG